MSEDKRNPEEIENKDMTDNETVEKQSTNMEKVEEVKTEKVAQPQPIESATVENSKKATKGFGIAAMVLGIVSLVFCCYVALSIPCAIMAIIFGVIGMKKSGRGMAIAGLVLGIITLCLCVMVLLFGMTFIAALIGFSEEMDYINTTINSSIVY